MLRFVELRSSLSGFCFHEFEIRRKTPAVWPSVQHEGVQTVGVLIKPSIRPLED